MMAEFYTDVAPTALETAAYTACKKVRCAQPAPRSLLAGTPVCNRLYDLPLPKAGHRPALRTNHSGRCESGRFAIRLGDARVRLLWREVVTKM